MKKTAAPQTVASRPAPGTASKAAAKPQGSGKPVASRKPSDAPMKHISPEEAVKHIQALLEAKHERVNEGPGWPGAEQQSHPSADPHATQSVSSSHLGPTADAQPEHTLSHQRGSRGKSGGGF